MLGLQQFVDNNYREDEEGGQSSESTNDSHTTDVSATLSISRVHGWKWREYT